MPRDLHAFTDAGTFALFDPEGLEPCDDDTPIDDAIAAATTDGSALVYSFEGDGEADFRVLVNESIPPTWRERRQYAIDGARLRSPSGMVMAAGVEYVWPTRDDAHASTITVPPGDYLVEAFNLTWDDVIENHLRTHAGARNVAIDESTQTLIGFGLSGVLVGALAALGSVMFQTWTPIKVAGILYGAYWLLLLPCLILPPVRTARRRVDAAMNALDGDFPEIVVALTPMDERTTFTPACFGSGYVDDPDAAPPLTARGCIATAIRVLIVCFVIALIIALVTSWVG